MDVEEKFLIPLKGLLLRDPRSKSVLPAEGAVKPWTGPEGRYWRRRVNDGSCIIGEAPRPAKPQKATFVREEE